LASFFVIPWKAFIPPPLLVKAGIHFILVGGAAAVAHGSSRLTNDLDIVYDRKDEDEL
jgi:hypothetical protein